VGQVLGLIIEKLTTLADAHDKDTLFRKRKAITALFPFAALQERDKQYPILDVFVKTSRACGLLWDHIGPFLETPLNGAGDFSLKRAIMLVSPYISWDERFFGEDMAQAWAATASTIPKEEEIAPSIVDTLFQITYWKLLQPHNHGDVWSWLTLRPPLPPVCSGRYLGSGSGVVRTVRGLEDIGILKSYLLLVWSEWDFLRDGFDEMCNLICEDFSGIEMYPCRADLVERLDQVLGQMNRGLEYLRQSKPEFHETYFQIGRKQYGKLRGILLEEDRKTLEVLTRTYFRLIVHFDLLTPVDVQSPTRHLCVRSLSHIRRSLYPLPTLPVC